MSTIKAALKSISVAVKAQKYDEVVQESQKLLVSDPKSYQGWVLGLLGCSRQLQLSLGFD